MKHAEVSARLEKALSETTLRKLSSVDYDNLRAALQAAVAEGANSPRWEPMGSAPKYPTLHGKRDYKAGVVYIDILAKTWIRDSDKFEFRRFTDCYWKEGDHNMNSWQDQWVGVDAGWLPVAWMPKPVIPTEWPLPV